METTSGSYQSFSAIIHSSGHGVGRMVDRFSAPVLSPPPQDPSSPLFTVDLNSGGAPRVAETLQEPLVPAAGMSFASRGRTRCHILMCSCCFVMVMIAAVLLFYYCNIDARTFFMKVFKSPVLQST